MINGTEAALGQEQSDSQQHVLFSRHSHPFVSENIGETSLTVDEQLMLLKSRCPLITFMPKKLDKHSIKEKCCFKCGLAKY